jgi:hypothetical protein
MLGTFGKVAVWVLALVGGYIVVKKYAPTVYSKTKDKLLSAKDKVKELTAGSASGSGSLTLVACGEGNPAGGDRKPNSGVQSSPFFRWCYLVKNGDTAGTISQKIVGDSSRYAELLVANPEIPKKGKMGEALGDSAWDFAPGALNEGTKIFIPQTMNSWIDQLGLVKGGYLPYPPDSRMMVETSGEEYGDSHEDESDMLTTSSVEGFDFQGAP